MRSRASIVRPRPVAPCLNERVQTQVEELPENRVRLTVQVPSHDVHHAVEHAADDLAQSVKVPGFRKGKVPRQVLLQRVGRERLMTEAVETHIGGWFWNAAARNRVRPVAQPEYDFELADGSTQSLTATVKEIKEKVLPPLDDDLARAASEFETFAELRADVESRLREQIEDEIETRFRADAADALVDASKVEVSGPLVESRTRELLRGVARQVEARGVQLETFLAMTGQQPEELVARLQDEAERSVARELVLDAVAEQLGLDVPDADVEELVREQAEAVGDDADEMIVALR